MSVFGEEKCESHCDECDLSEPVGLKSHSPGATEWGVGVPCPRSRFDFWFRSCARRSFRPEPVATGRRASSVERADAERRASSLERASACAELEREPKRDGIKQGPGRGSRARG